MIKISLFMLLAIICNGCVSSIKNHSHMSKSSIPVKSVDKRLVKYGIAQGCAMMPSGYMVCPK